ncbi:monooxygenase [Sphaerisporangium fuscum]|uniref:monooxygenase n=1 Tax=Sphaerisporangium fuscum TaxID=2835868 RepID=UPI001BDCAEE4|nr:monooxygenase [Sphaerisporangium fuscum]
MKHPVLAGAAATFATALLIAACAPSQSTGGSVANVGQEHAAGAHSSSPAVTAGTHTGHGQPFKAPPPQPLRASERFVELKLPQPYTPAAPSGGTDEYRCFLIDPGLKQKAFLTGSQFLPQNSAIVHHAIVFRLPPDKARAAQDLDARTPGEGWTCFGDTGVDGDSWIGHWAPGANETLLKQKVGYPLPPGSRLVLQIHYNLLATQGKPGESDQSAIRLRLTDGKAGLTPLETAQLPAPIELPCAQGESGPLCDRAAAVRDVAHRFGQDAERTVNELNQFCNQGKPPVPGPTQHCDQPTPTGGTIYAVAGHMHLLGRSIKIELNPGRPDARTLLDIPVYNFDDQAIRPLAEPVTVKRGDTFRVTCTHDAGLRGMLPALQGQPARYVVWGDGTSDEMCLGLLVWTPGAAPRR